MGKSIIVWNNTCRKDERTLTFTLTVDIFISQSIKCHWVTQHWIQHMWLHTFPKGIFWRHENMGHLLLTPVICSNSLWPLLLKVVPPCKFEYLPVWMCPIMCACSDVFYYIGLHIIPCLTCLVIESPPGFHVRKLSESSSFSPSLGTFLNPCDNSKDFFIHYFMSAPSFVRTVMTLISSVPFTKNIIIPCPYSSFHSSVTEWKFMKAYYMFKKMFKKTPIWHGNPSWVPCFQKCSESYF